MTRQGIHIKEHVSHADILQAAGLEPENTRPVRTAVVHIHLRRPSARMKRIMESLDSMVGGHKIRHKGTTWKVASTESISPTEHKGHTRNRGAAFEYFLEEEV